MKRTISFMVIIMLVFSLSACGVGRASGKITTEAEEVTEDAVATETETVTESEIITESEYKAAYKAKLEAILNGSEILYEGMDNNIAESCFSLIYLDNDDVPELVVSDGFLKFAQVTLYSYDGNDVINQGKYGSFGNFEYLPRKGFLITEFGGGGGKTVTYYKFENNSVAQLCGIYIGVKDFAGNSEELKYVIDEVELSEEEYQSYISKFGKEEDYKTALVYYMDSDSDLPDGVYSLNIKNINNL